MRPETERLVRESWAQFEPVAVESAAFFYEKLFELDPEAERLFATTDMVAQGHKVMRMFAEIVHTLDRPETLVAEVADLGRRHVRLRRAGSPVRLGRYRAALDARARAGAGLHGRGQGRLDRGLPPLLHRRCGGPLPARRSRKATKRSTVSRCMNKLTRMVRSR